jgi:hypothetical protein
MAKGLASLCFVMTATQRWLVSAEYQLAEGEDPLRPQDQRVPALHTWLERTYGGGASVTLRGWVGKVVVSAGPEIHFIDQAEAYGVKLIQECVETVGLPHCALVSRSVIDADTYVAELEIYGSRELAELLGVSRQRLAQLRAEGTLPEPDLVLAATPVWMKRTVDHFTWGWRRRPGPAPGANDSDLDHLLSGG